MESTTMFATEAAAPLAAAATSSAPPDVDSWARGVLESLGVPSTARGTGGAPLAIAVGLPHRPRKAEDAGGADHHPLAASTTAARRPAARRDNQHRREERLKGQEGSRQRRRWENDRLIGVPHAQPPLPSDWEVRPTHPVHYGLPYHVAQYWDKGLRQAVNEARAAAAVRRRQKAVAHDAGTATPTLLAPATARIGVVTRELRATAKKTPAVKTWVRLLEEPVRAFLQADEAVLVDHEEDDSLCGYSDDEVVFVGRQRQHAGSKSKPHRPSWVQPVDDAAARPQADGLVFDALGADQEGSFKRWLAHSIADYYGLASHAATTGTPPRRVVYVARPDAAPWPLGARLPRPMWELF